MRLNEKTQYKKSKQIVNIQFAEPEEGKIGMIHLRCKMLWCLTAITYKDLDWYSNATPNILRAEQLNITMRRN